MIRHSNWKVRVPIASIMLLGLVLAGCASLPAPEGPGDTLLVVDVFRETEVADDDERGGSIFGHVEATIQRTDDPTVGAVLSLNASKNYEAVHGLPPGEYRITRVVFQYRDANTPQPLEIPDGTVRLEAGGLTVAPWLAAYRIEGSSGSNRMFIGMGEQIPELREQLLAELAEEEAFSAWRILPAE